MTIRKLPRQRDIPKLEFPAFSDSITVREIDPADQSWLRREARQTGVSMEELGRRPIHEERTKTECRPKPSEAFARYFGEHHDIEFQPRARLGYKPFSFSIKNRPCSKTVSAYGTGFTPSRSYETICDPKPFKNGTAGLPSATGPAIPMRSDQ